MNETKSLCNKNNNNNNKYTKREHSQYLAISSLLPCPMIPFKRRPFLIVLNLINWCKLLRAFCSIFIFHWSTWTHCQISCCRSLPRVVWLRIRLAQELALIFSYRGIESNPLKVQICYKTKLMSTVQWTFLFSAIGKSAE